MGIFDYPAPSVDVKMISAILDQPKAEMFQVSSFHMTYFNDPWTLPSPSTMMEGKGHHGMSMPLSTTDFVYSIVQQDFYEPDPTFAKELDPVFEPTRAQGSLATTDSLELVFPFDEVLIEALTSPDKTWDDLHHRSYFVLDLGRIEAGEFMLTMTGDRYRPINPLATHAVYTEVNIEIIAKMIPIVISRTLGVMENVFVGAHCSPEEIQIYIDLFK
jgi:hypothetical protein